MKIRGKLILSFCTVTLLILVVFGVITYSTFSGSIRRDVKQLYDAKANEILLFIDREIRKAVYHVTLEMYPLINSKSEQENQDELLRKCKHFASDPEEYGLFNFIASARLNEENDLQVETLCGSNDAYFSLEKFLTPAFFSKLSDEETVIVPIEDDFYIFWKIIKPHPDSRQANLRHADSVFLIAGLNKPLFQQTVRSLIPREEMASIILFAKDKFVVRVDKQQVPPGKGRNDLSEVESVKSEDLSFYGRKMLSFSSPQSSMGLRLDYIISRDNYMENLITLKNRIIAALLILAWIAIWVVLIIAYRLSKPIVNLAKVTNDMIKFNYKSPIDIKPSNDEIGQLTKSFETMRLEIEHLVTMDPLTKTYNRRYLMHVMDMEVTKATRTKADLSCIMLDIDYFKKVNDNYGHQAGDEILKELGAILNENTRKYDTVAAFNSTVARYGGEEFTILLPATSAVNAVQVAERIRVQVESHVMSNSLRCTLSLGVAQFNADLGGNVETLIENADRALYEAKNNGRNQVVLYVSQDKFHFQNKTLAEPAHG